MHLIQLPEEIVVTPSHTLKPGAYIAEDLNGAQLIVKAGDGSMTPLVERRPFYEDLDWNGKSILIIRAGGFGDLVNLTPVLREIKRRWPNAIIAVSSMANYGSALENLNFVDKTIKYPVLVEDAQKYDAWIFYEKAIEKNPLAEELHMTDVFASIAGLKGKDWTENKKPSYNVTGSEANWAEVQFPRKPGLRRLVVQVGASADCRVYPIWNLEQIVNKLAQEDWEVFLMEKPGSLNVQSTERIKNLSGMGLTFRQSAAALATGDCFLGADSAYAHVAGALDIPAVALFGPFPWKLRTAYSPSIHAIQGTAKCAPCFHHANPMKRGDQFPAKCPSRDKEWPGQEVDPQRPDKPLQRGYCEVLASIEPKRVLAIIRKVAKPLPKEVTS